MQAKGREYKSIICKLSKNTQKFLYSIEISQQIQNPRQKPKNPKINND